MKIYFNYSNPAKKEVLFENLNCIDTILENVSVSMILDNNCQSGLNLNGVEISFDAWDLHSFLDSFTPFCNFLFNEETKKEIIELYDQGTMIKLNFTKDLSLVYIKGDKISEDTEFSGNYSTNKSLLKKEVKEFYKVFSRWIKENSPKLFTQPLFKEWNATIKKIIDND